MSLIYDCNCPGFRANNTLTFDTQDLREGEYTKCPYCHAPFKDTMQELPELVPTANDNVIPSMESKAEKSAESFIKHFSHCEPESGLPPYDGKDLVVLKLIKDDQRAMRDLVKQLTPFCKSDPVYNDMLLNVLNKKFIVTYRSGQDPLEK